MRSLPARERSSSPRPSIPSPARVIGGCETTTRSRYRTDGGRRATAKIPAPRQPCFCCERFVRKRQRMKKAPFPGSFLRAVAENVWRGQAHIVRRAGQRKEKPCSSALSPCRCLETSLALRLTHLRLGSDLSPRTAAAGTFQRDRKKHFRGKDGGRGRKAPLFQKGLLPPPPYNRPGDDSRTGKTSRPVPDRWRSARPFR